MSNTTTIHASVAPGYSAKLSYAGLTDQGRIRQKNEDNFGVFPDQGLFFVTDGIGGMPAGDVASLIIVEVLPDLIKQRISHPEQLSSHQIIVHLKQALIDLSNRLLHQSKNKAGYAGMGATLALVLVINNQCYIAHLGDSRVYLYSTNKLQQLTHDHSLVHHLLMANVISQEEALNHPGKNQLVRYIGMEGTPAPDVICIPRRSGERLLLCTDGLTNMLSDVEISQFLSASSTPEQICKELIAAANQAGGRDNITAVLVD